MGIFRKKLIRQPQSEADHISEELHEVKKDEKGKISKYEDNGEELIKNPVSPESRKQLARQRSPVQRVDEDE